MEGVSLPEKTNLYINSSHSISKDKIEISIPDGVLQVKPNEDLYLTVISLNTFYTFYQVIDGYNNQFNTYDNGVKSSFKLPIGNISVTARDLLLRFNSDAGTNYSYTVLNGTGSAAASSRNIGISRILPLQPTTLQPTTPQLLTIDIFSYAGSTNKTVHTSYSGDLNGSGQVIRQSSFWKSTSAITAVNISVASDTLAIGTTATLFGIKAA